MQQLLLPIEREAQAPPEHSGRQALEALLSHDLDFRGAESGYASHNFHAFPAKFPPQLPRTFILGLTKPGETVLDPMMGSGTTVVEALLAGRRALGYDIDPLAVLTSRVKTTSLDAAQVASTRLRILTNATLAVRDQRAGLEAALDRRWDDASREFVDYWFTHDTQVELLALLREIEQIPQPALRDFLALAFSAIIVTKSGGVSLAFDLAHTRPHRAKVIYARSGEAVLGGDPGNAIAARARHLTKTPWSPLEEFDRRSLLNLRGLASMGHVRSPVLVSFGDAQALPLPSQSVDLIVTSPPDASNAIDYMRAHKFSLVWLGYPVGELGRRRSAYIGGESATGTCFEHLPARTAQLVDEIAALDARKGQALRRYYSEMTRVLREMWRVLKPGKAAIVVVGNSVMRGRDTQTHACLAEIGQTLGFDVPMIGVRGLDRDRRMMPVAHRRVGGSQIEQRMHEEYVIGLLKPASGGDLPLGEE